MHIFSLTASTSAVQKYSNFDSIFLRSASLGIKTIKSFKFQFEATGLHIPVWEGWEVGSLLNH